MTGNVEGAARICPRCAEPFICRNDDIIHCECVNVPLSAEDRAYIAERYDTCLCVGCLKILARQRRNEARKNDMERIFHVD